MRGEKRRKGDWSWQVRKQQIRQNEWGERREMKTTEDQREDKRGEEVKGKRARAGDRSEDGCRWEERQERTEREREIKEIRQDKRRRVSLSSFQPQALVSISLDYTLLPLKILVHTLVYTAWVFAFLFTTKTRHCWKCWKCICPQNQHTHRWWSRFRKKRNPCLREARPLIRRRALMCRQPTCGVTVAEQETSCMKRISAAYNKPKHRAVGPLCS